MPTHQGKNVTELRPAKQGDQGFDAAKDQVVIRNENGSEQTVPRSEVSKP